jgi:hypothetical protein
MDTFAAKRARAKVAMTVSPRLGSVRSRKSSGPRRTTTRVAITRAFGVRRSASHGASVTSFETIRCRKSSASGPWTRT